MRRRGLPAPIPLDDKCVLCGKKFDDASQGIRFADSLSHYAHIRCMVRYTIPPQVARFD